MDKQQAHSHIQVTLEATFDRAKFTYLAKNLLNNLDETKAFHARGYVPEIFKDYIRTYERIGTYTDPDNKKIDILVVYLQKETSVERARTAQRNFAARYLKDRGQKDAGLIAFVSPNMDDWRFSFVKMEYKFEETAKGSVKVKEEFTPAKRYSFLVGKNENSHTAQSRLVPLLLRDERNPKLDEIEELFSVEKATKEFFEKYRDLYLRTYETLETIVAKDKALKADFNEKGVSTVDFCKKLLGQIVFLYFLQRKGWFGVPLKKTWGNGDKHFLRSIYNQAITSKKNYFNDYLEPLFYEALAVERPDDYYSKFECRIPFLNGGLFDPINNYNWVDTVINLPNNLFSNNTKNKEGDEGDGILDIFDRFNFTVKEDEPLEKEVAVDPEMLGKVFENLLEVKDRKSKGTYYTPREIVHYMCVQSLVNYLTTELEGKVSKDDLEQLIKYGDLVGENEARVEEKGKETPTYFYKLPENVREHAKAIDKKLADIKVCDPAIGSGAFPVGMMTEIVRARNVLSAYITDSKRSIYNFKRHCIHNSLYGVDIDPGAIEIAKLRLWLSLIVDEEDIKQIKPLPNLDYKIMQGNSLIEEYEGVKLFDDTLLTKESLGKSSQLKELEAKQSRLSNEYIKLHSSGRLTKAKQLELKTELHNLSKLISQTKASKPKPSLQFDAYHDSVRRADELKKLHESYFDAMHKKDKDRIKQTIEALEWELIEATLKEQGKTSELKKLDEFKKSNTKPFFLWRLNFAEVFQEKGGFDVVIGNPPYLNVELVSKNDKEYFARTYRTFYKRFDVFGLFFELGLVDLVTNGTVTFIIPQQIFNNLSYKKLRDLMLNNKWLHEVLYLGDKIFEAANNDVCVLFLRKPAVNNIRLVNAIDYNDWSVAEVPTNYFEKFNNIISFSADSFAECIFDKIFDVKHEKVRERFDVFQGIVTGNNVAFLPTESDVHTAKIERQLLHPVLLGRDFEKWLIRSRDRQILYINGATDIKEFPNTESWLSKFKGDLKKRRECQRGIIPWYSLQWPRDKQLLDLSPKIIVQGTRNPRLKLRIIATMDEMGVYGTQGVNFIVPKSESAPLYYLLGIFNSSLINYLYTTKFLNVAIKAEYLKDTPIPKADKSSEQAITSIVKEAIALKNKHPEKDISDLESKLNNIVYNLYGLTKEEIEIVELSLRKE